MRTLLIAACVALIALVPAYTRADCVDGSTQRYTVGDVELHHIADVIEYFENELRDTIGESGFGVLVGVWNCPSLGWSHFVRNYRDDDGMLTYEVFTTRAFFEDTSVLDLRRRAQEAGCLIMVGGVPLQGVHPMMTFSKTVQRCMLTEAIRVGDMERAHWLARLTRNAPLPKVLYAQ